MTKRFVLILVCMTFSLALWAQKKEIQQIEELLKKGTQIDKAQTMAEKLLKDSANQQNPRIWYLLGECRYKQYETQNKQMYLGEKTDTASFFANIKNLFRIYQTADSLLLKINKPNKHLQKNVQKRAIDLNKCRSNLYFGGLFKIYKGQFGKAYNYFDDYLNCVNAHLFKAYNYNQTDTLLFKAAYWAMYCGYKNSNSVQTLHHAYTALKDTTRLLTVFQFLGEAYKLEKDTIRYLDALKEGFQRDPSFPYFFPRLFNYYSSKGDWNTCIHITDKAIQADKSNLNFHLAKSSVLLYTERFDSCIVLCDSLLALSDTLSRAHLNAGLSYYYKAVRLDRKLKKTAAEKRDILRFYTAAKPHMEAYRKSDPQADAEWALPLYIIYLNLNMGAELDEIDRFMNQKRLRNGSKKDT